MGCAGLLVVVSLSAYAARHSLGRGADIRSSERWIAYVGLGRLRRLGLSRTWRGRSFTIALLAAFLGVGIAGIAGWTGQDQFGGSVWRSLVLESAIVLLAAASAVCWIGETRTRPVRPILLVVDDLDRCSGEYVVELLGVLQTLIQDSAEGRLGGGDVPAPLVFLVAADHRWLAASHNLHLMSGRTGDERSGTISGVAQPGRSLGSSYVAKMFQIEVMLPHIEARQMGSYFASLVGENVMDGAIDEPSVGRVEVAPEDGVVAPSAEDGTTQSDPTPNVQGSPDEAERLNALEELAQEVVESDRREIEEVLTRLLHVVDPNPRSIKRVVNSYCIAKAVAAGFSMPPTSDQLAMWVILRDRWPELGDFLADHLGHELPSGTSSDLHALCPGSRRA